MQLFLPIPQKPDRPLHVVDRIETGVGRDAIGKNRRIEAFLMEIPGNIHALAAGTGVEAAAVRDDDRAPGFLFRRTVRRYKDHVRIFLKRRLLRVETWRTLLPQENLLEGLHAFDPEFQVALQIKASVRVPVEFDIADCPVVFNRVPQKFDVLFVHNRSLT